MGRRTEALPEAEGSDQSVLAVLRWDAKGDAALAGLEDSGWRSLMEVLRADQGHAYLARRLQLSSEVAVPGWVREELDTASLATAARNAFGFADLAACLREAGCPVIALKGLDLAHRVYGRFGVRQMGDLDLLVPPSSVVGLDRVLREHGYKPDLDLTGGVITDIWLHHVAYAPPKGAAMPVEVHWRLTRGEWCSLDIDGLWERSTDMSADMSAAAQPFPARVMSVEDTFLYLCAHIAHHGFETSLTQIWDLAEVLRWAGDRFDWTVLWQRAQDKELAGVVQLCAYQLERTLGVTVPDAAIPLPRPPRPVLEAMPSVLANLGLYPPDGGLGNTLRLAAILTSETGWPYRLTLARQVLVPRRSELAILLGEAVPPWWMTPVHYARYWHRLWGSKRRLVWQWLSGRQGARRTAKRRGVLLAWLRRS